MVSHAGGEEIRVSELGWFGQRGDLFPDVGGSRSFTPVVGEGKGAGINGWPGGRRGTPRIKDRTVWSPDNARRRFLDRSLFVFRVVASQVVFVWSIFVYVLEWRQ